MVIIQFNDFNINSFISVIIKILDGLSEEIKLRALSILWYYWFGKRQIQKLIKELRDTQDSRELKVLRSCEAILNCIEEGILNAKDDSETPVWEESKVNQNNNSKPVKGVINIDSMPRRNQLLETRIDKFLCKIMKNPKYKKQFISELKEIKVKKK